MSYEKQELTISGYTSWVLVDHLFSFLYWFFSPVFCLRSVSCTQCRLCILIFHSWLFLWVFSKIYLRKYIYAKTYQLKIRREIMKTESIKNKINVKKGNFAARHFDVWLSFEYIYSNQWHQRRSSITHIQLILYCYFMLVLVFLIYTTHYI